MTRTTQAWARTAQISYIPNMLIALYILGGLLLVALLFLSLLLRVRLRLAPGHNRVIVRYGPFLLHDSTHSAKPKPKVVAKKAKPARAEPVEGKPSVEKASFRERWPAFKAALKLAPRVAACLGRFAYRLLRKFHFEFLHGKVHGGLPDPADTGALTGWVYGALGAIPALGKKFSFEPDFAAERLLYDIEAALTFRPIAAVGPTLQLLWEAPLWELYRVIRVLRAKPKGKTADETIGAAAP